MDTHIFDENNPLEVSVEFYPPTTPEGQKRFENAVKALNNPGPGVKVALATVTLGTNEDLPKSQVITATLKAVADIRKLAPNIPVSIHLPANLLYKDEIEDLLIHDMRAGGRHYLALSGEPERTKRIPIVEKKFYLENSTELVRLIRDVAYGLGYEDVHIDVAADPRDPNAVTTFLAKERAGTIAFKPSYVKRGLMQYWFDTQAIVDFLKKFGNDKLTQHIIPGLMYVFNFERVKAIAADHGVPIPADMHKEFDGMPPREAGVNFMAKQMAGLMSAGIRRLHIYCMNNDGWVVAAQTAVELFNKQPPRNPMPNRTVIPVPPI